VSYADKTLTCRECGQAFVFSSGEQEFHASKGFTNEPSRCPDCRAARRADRGGGGGGYSSGGYGGGGGGGYGRQERQMYSATCSSCGQEARVPFEPRGDKPVYCSNCGNVAHVPFEPRGDKPVYCSDCFDRRGGRTGGGGGGGGRGYR
jgi:CxxC-x17-CxxC domain-containing protein